ncbi:O-antigen ligase family protein [Aureimonas flava]|nr:O-antigen ligase family protein [Aureimonas flava]
MPFRLMYLAAYAAFILNLGDLFKIEAANALVKSLFLLAGALFLVGRELNPFALANLLIVTVMIFFLGSMTDYPDFQWSYLLNALNQYMLIYLLLSARPTAADRDTVLISAAWFAVACSVLGLMYQVAGLRTAFPVEFNTGQNRFSGSLNAAFLGGFAMSGMLASLLLTELGRPRYYILLLLNAGVMIATGARVALAVAVGVCGLAFLFSKRRTASQKITGIAAGVAAACVIGPIAYVRYAARMSGSGLSGREIMWPWLEELSARYPDFGIGFGHQYWSTPREIYILFSSMAAHNDYLRLLVELGHVGVWVFYILLVATVWYTKTIWGGRDPVPLFALAGFLAISITDNALATPTHFLLVLVGMFAACGTHRNEAAARPPAAPSRVRGAPRRFGATEGNLAGKAATP